MARSPIDNNLVEEATAWRRHLHAHPETAFEEKATADFVATKLKEFGIEVHRGLGGTGVVGTLKRGTSPVAVGLRADMDALFIQEENTFDHRSTIDGKMHACGHDGHTAMLLAAASHLARNGDFDGTVRFIFQPAEETGDQHCGGNAMVKDGLFEKFPVDAVFGMHNFPNVPAGRFMMRTGPMLASIDTFEFHVLSRIAHPATQFAVADPLLTAAAIVQEMHMFKARYLNPAEPVVLSITQFRSGDPSHRQGVHVTPDEAVVRGTLYTLNDSVRDAFEAGLEKIVRNATEAVGAGHKFIFERGYPVLRNTRTETQFAASVGNRWRKARRRRHATDHGRRGLRVHAGQRTRQLRVPRLSQRGRGSASPLAHRAIRLQRRHHRHRRALLDDAGGALSRRNARAALEQPAQLLVRRRPWRRLASCLP